MTPFLLVMLCGIAYIAWDARADLIAQYEGE